MASHPASQTAGLLEQDMGLALSEVVWLAEVVWMADSADEHQWLQRHLVLRQQLQGRRRRLDVCEAQVQELETRLLMLQEGCC